MIIVFVVQYEQEVIHAVDGLGYGVVLVPVMGNFLLKIYEGGKGNPFGAIVKALLELAHYL